MSNRPFWLCSWLIIASAILVGCGGSGTPPSPAASASAAVSATVKSQPSAPAQSVTGSLPIKPASPDEWEQIMAAAKREGQVGLMSQGGAEVSNALVSKFKARYPDIQVEFSGGSGGEIASKLLTERHAGRFGVDLIVHGTTTLIADLIPDGAVDPLQPFLVGPDNTDPKQWLGGKFDFADDTGKYDLIFTGGVSGPMVYNPQLVSASEFGTLQDLLKPKWKGKIAMYDPRVAGAGLAQVTFWYTTPGLGKEFIQQLFGQQGVIFTRDNRQLADWIARGQYPIGLATQYFSVIDLKKTGVPLEFLGAESLKEGSYLTASWGSVGVLNKAPHPNAAKVYLNWLLSKEGQEAQSTASGYPSRRLDAQNVGLADFLNPKPGVEYQDNSKEEYVRIKDEVIAFLKTAIRD